MATLFERDLKGDLTKSFLTRHLDPLNVSRVGGRALD